MCFCDCKATFSHDLSEIIVILFCAQETLNIIINNENKCITYNFCGTHDRFDSGFLD